MGSWAPGYRVLALWLHYTGSYSTYVSTVHVDMYITAVMYMFGIRNVLRTYYVLLILLILLILLMLLMLLVIWPMYATCYLLPATCYLLSARRVPNSNPIPNSLPHPCPITLLPYYPITLLPYYPITLLPYYPIKPTYHILYIL
jgi:hypothetical protein